MPVGRGGGEHGRRKNRETVTDSLCLVFKGRGRNLAPPLIKSINKSLPRRKSLSNQLALLTKSIQCSYYVESN